MSCLISYIVPSWSFLHFRRIRRIWSDSRIFGGTPFARQIFGGGKLCLSPMHKSVTLNWKEREIGIRNEDRLRTKKLSKTAYTKYKRGSHAERRSWMQLKEKKERINESRLLSCDVRVKSARPKQIGLLYFGVKGR